MSNATVLGLLTLIGVAAFNATFAQTPAPQTTRPAAASSEHQREVTGQSSPEAPATSSPEASAASTPHQNQVLGKGEGADPAMFVRKATQGGIVEVELGKAALSKTPDPVIRAFADRMVKDHGKANAELAGIARGKGLTVPSTLDAEHMAVVRPLSMKVGRDFDTAYSAQMKADHQKAMALFESAAKSSDRELAAFATKTLPTLREHAQMAESLPGGSR